MTPVRRVFGSNPSGKVRDLTAAASEYSFAVTLQTLTACVCVCGGRERTVLPTQVSEPGQMRFSSAGVPRASAIRLEPSSRDISKRARELLLYVNGFITAVKVKILQRRDTMKVEKYRESDNAVFKRELKQGKRELDMDRDQSQTHRDTTQVLA